MPRYEVVYTVTITREYVTSIRAANEDTAEQAMQQRLDNIVDLETFPGDMSDEGIEVEITEINEE